MIKYDGMPEPEMKEEVEQELNQDELIGFIMRNTADRTLLYEDVKAVLKAETRFLLEKGFIDSNEWEG